MITATSKPNTTETNTSNEILQARNKLKKVPPNALPSAKEESAAVAAAREVPPQPLQQNSTNQIHSNDAQERTLAIITLDGNLDAITQHIKSYGFSVLNTKAFRLSMDQAKEFYQDYEQDQTYYDKYTTWLSSCTLYALVLEKENAIQEWKTLMGPGQYKKARKIQPDSIRARFSKDGSQNATHGSDSDTNVKKEIEFIFSSSVCSAETQDTAAANNHVDQQDDSASSSESQQVKEEMTHNSNTENGATIHHHDETVSSTEEKANNASTPSTTNIALNNDANDPETEVKSNISITPALVDDQINGVMQTAEETDQSIIVGNTSKTQDKPADANKENDKHIDKNTIIDQAKDIKPNDNQKVEKSDAIANTAAAIETVTTVTTEIVTSSTEAAVTTVVSDISTENTKNEEHHDGTESSNVQIKPSESNTGATPQTKTENDLVMEDNKSNAAENDILLAQQSKGEQQCDSVANNEDKKSNITPSPKEKDDCQAQNETKQSQEASGEKNEAVSTPKDEHISSEKNEKLSASREQVKTNQRPEDKEGKKVILEVKEKTRSPQTTPTISPKNKLLTKSTKEANNVKGDKVRPSISRIPPPSIKRGQSTSLISSLKSTVSSTKQLLGPERRLRTASITGAKAMTNGHASAGATRIARLSSASTNSSSSSDQEKKPANPQAKKPLTKVSKHLPRVATMTTTQQKPLPSAQPNVKKESTGEKPKKRVSSTKSFISRLTAPTVASANKKSDHHETAIQHNSSNGVVRRTTLTKKQGLVKPSHSTGTSKSKQKKKEDSNATDKVSIENNANETSRLHESPIMDQIANTVNESNPVPINAD